MQSKYNQVVDPNDPRSKTQSAHLIGAHLNNENEPIADLAFTRSQSEPLYGGQMLDPNKDDGIKENAPCTARRPNSLPLRQNMIQLGSLSPVGVGQVCPHAPRQSPSKTHSEKFTPVMATLKEVDENGLSNNREESGHIDEGITAIITVYQDDSTSSGRSYIGYLGSNEASSGNDASYRDHFPAATTVSTQVEEAHCCCPRLTTMYEWMKAQAMRLFCCVGMNSSSTPPEFELDTYYGSSSPEDWYSCVDTYYGSSSSPEDWYSCANDICHNAKKQHARWSDNMVAAARLARDRREWRNKEEAYTQQWVCKRAETNDIVQWAPIIAPHPPRKIGIHAKKCEEEGRERTFRGKEDWPQGSQSGLCFEFNTEYKYAFETKLWMYLNRRPSMAHNFLLDNISLPAIERLYFRKIEMEQEKPIEHQDMRDLLKWGRNDLTIFLSSLKESQSVDELLFALAQNVGTLLQGDAFRLFKVHTQTTTKFIEVYSAGKDQLQKFQWREVKANVDHLEVLRRKSIMCFTRQHDPLFLAEESQTIFKRKTYHKNKLRYLILIPVAGEHGEITHILEVWKGSGPFQSTDVQIALSFKLWGALSILYSKKLSTERKKNHLNDFLLMTVQAIFEDMVSLDHVVMRILQYAQKLVNADRASLFMVDNESSELVSRVFDLTVDGNVSKGTNEIRIPIARGIAGHVALTGESVNIPDAYADDRFNCAVDEATGYRTTSILCMPVKVDRNVIGVVQMVNKRGNEKFSHDDERSFKIFSPFFGLALHYAGLYDIITRNEQKYKVALEVLSYHNTCRENEVSELRAIMPLSQGALEDFYLNPFKFNPMEKCQAVLVMFDDLFNMKNFDSTSLARFTLTVKKNYREVPYHNFHHGWSVAQSTYVILKSDTDNRFDYKERLALFIASLCHDLDHRGYTNKYMNEIASPLAAMYTTSTLEHHHFNITVSILQQEGHNIFDRFSSEEYKEMLGLIKTCILSTDLAAFFPNIAQLEVERIDNTFDWTNSKHKTLAMALSMTAADLSAAAKPWEIQIETVKVIFKEFYDQGDKERTAGRQPLPMMDRETPEEQPASQVGFLQSICLPCYGMLGHLLPGTENMYLMAAQNLRIWEKKAKKVERERLEKARALEDVSLNSFPGYSQGAIAGSTELNIGSVVTFNSQKGDSSENIVSLEDDDCKPLERICKCRAAKETAI